MVVADRSIPCDLTHGANRDSDQGEADREHDGYSSRVGRDRADKNISPSQLRVTR